MPQIVKTGYLTDPDNTNGHLRTTTGQDILALPLVPCMTLLTIDITGTATVVIQYSEDKLTFIPVATVTETTGVQFAIPASVLAIDTIMLSGSVRAVYRTVTLDNIPSQTLILYGNGTVTNPITQSIDSTPFVLADGTKVMTGAIDLTGVTAGSPSAKANATSDTPTVAFTDSGAANHAPTTAPAGYLEVLIGGVSRYIPFWA